MASSFVLNIGRVLTWMCRHSAPALGMSVERGGWVPWHQIAATCAFRSTYKGTSIDQVEEAVNNSGGRLEFNGRAVRALNGHSFVIENTDDLYEEWDGERATHLTNLGALRRILQVGEITSCPRIHVHLYPGVELDKDLDVAIVVDLEQLRREGGTSLATKNGHVLVPTSIPQCYWSQIHIRTPSGWKMLDLNNNPLDQLPPPLSSSRKEARRYGRFARKDRGHFQRRTRDSSPYDARAEGDDETQF